MATTFTVMDTAKAATTTTNPIITSMLSPVATPGERSGTLIRLGRVWLHPGQRPRWHFANSSPDAIAAGVFDDEDARGVKGLDDLGGGRIYQSDAGGVSQRDQVHGKTMRILEQGNKRFVELWPPVKCQC